MELDAEARVLRALGNIPEVLRAVVAVIPPAPEENIEGDVFMIHCLLEESGAIHGTPELIEWLREQAYTVVATAQSEKMDSGIGLIAVTIRLTTRGANHIVYGCQVPAGVTLPPRSRMSVESVSNMLMVEFSHDQEVIPLLTGAAER